MTTSYQARIRSDCRCGADDAARIENIMRDFVLHSTMDWLSAAQFRSAARKARRIYQADKAMFDEYFAAIRTQFLKDRQAQV